MVQIDADGNYTTYDVEQIRADAENQAWEDQRDRDRIRANKRRMEQGTLFANLSDETMDRGEDLRKRMLTERWGRHKRKRVKRKVFGGFLLPAGYRSPGTHGKGD